MIIILCEFFVAKPEEYFAVSYPCSKTSTQPPRNHAKIDNDFYTGMHYGPVIEETFFIAYYRDTAPRES